MDIIKTIGWLAAIFTCMAYVPQAIKIIRTRHTKDLSLTMYSFMNVGILCWLIYGIMLSDLPIIIANAITLILTLTILVMKIRFK